MSESYDAHAAGTRPDGRVWEVVQYGGTVTATVDGLPGWSLDHATAEGARHTWQLLTALAEPAEVSDGLAGEPMDETADGW